MCAAYRDERAAEARAQAQVAAAQAGGPDNEHVETSDLLEQYLLARAAFGDQPQLRRIDAHLEICADCRARAAVVKEALDEMASPDQETIEWAWDTVRAEAKAERERTDAERRGRTGP